MSRAVLSETRKISGSARARRGRCGEYSCHLPGATRT